MRSCVILTIASSLLTMPTALDRVQGQTDASLSSTAEQPTTAREFYNAAAHKMQAQDPRSASLHLLGLLKEHPNSELAPTATFFLSECQLAMRSPQTAYETLTSYPNWPDNLRPTVHERTKFAARMAAAQELQSGRRIESIHWLVLAAELADEASRPGIEQQIVQTANAELTSSLSSKSASLDSINACFETLQVRCKLPKHLLPQLQFAAAENLRKAGQLSAALKWYSIAEQSVEGEGESQADSQWLKTVALRQCEVLVAQKKFEEAKQRIDSEFEKDQSESSPPELVAYLRLLQVRCHIARIEFEQAFQTLDTVDSLPDCSDCVYAQAGWMRGELHFMQRQYDLAVAAYERVDPFDADQWQSLALLQKAKCLELLGRNQEAVVAYERVRNEFSSSSGLRTAEERLATLPQATTQIDNSREVTR